MTEIKISFYVEYLSDSYNNAEYKHYHNTQAPKRYVLNSVTIVIVPVRVDDL